MKQIQSCTGAPSDRNATGVESIREGAASLAGLPGDAGAYPPNVKRKKFNAQASDAWLYGHLRYNS